MSLQANRARTKRGQIPENASLSVPQERFDRRAELMSKLTTEFAKNESVQMVETHKSLYGKTSRLILPPEMNALCRALHVNPGHENMSPQGWPLKVVDGGKEVAALLS